MAMNTPNANAAFLPDHVHGLVVQPALDVSVAAQVATVVTASESNTRFRVPVVATDPSAAWVAEGAEITPTDATLAEVTDTYHKLAGLTIISSELADDSTPAAASVVGQGLARDIARKLDAAFFGNVGGEAPDGLETATGATDVDAASYVDLDPFAEAVSEAEQLGATISAWVTDPATALSLATLKDETGSNRPLLGTDPTVPTKRSILGVPLYVSPGVTTGVVWGIPADRTFLAMRRDTTLTVDRSAYFSSDRVGVRAIMRTTFGFAHPAALVRIAEAGS